MKLKTVIIGGSNTVMLPGYLPTLLSTMARRGIELDVMADLAVGGTTSALGLYQLKIFEQLEECELLVIEYAINDAFVYGDERRPFRHWARFYEGIIRYALERNPNLHIATLVLAPATVLSSIRFRPSTRASTISRNGMARSAPMFRAC